MNTNYSYHLPPSSKSDSHGISLITAVKNRIDTLSEVFPTWVNQPEIDEIIIVDWSSDQSLAPLIKKYQNGKINLAIVKGQSKWILTQAFNLAARLTTKDQILKVDADVKILPGFFKKHLLKPGLFYSGNWTKGRDENEKHLNGIVFLYKTDFFKVNGYNEFIKSYGWDDTDLYERLESSGLTRVDINLDTLSHIHHENRTTLQDKTNFLLHIPDIEKASISILINRFISNHYKKWSVEDKMSNFNVEVKGTNTFHCTQVGEDKNIIPDDISTESELVAIKERLDQLGFKIDTDLDKHFTFEEIKALYFLFQSKNATPENRVLFDLINKYNYHYSYNIKQRNEGFQRLSADVAAKDYIIEEQKKEIKKLDEMRKENDMALWNYDQVLKEKEAFLQAKEALIIEKDKVIHSHVMDLHMKDKLLNEKNTSIQQIENTLIEKEREIGIQNAEILLKEAIIKEKENTIKFNEELILEKSLLLHQSQQLITDQENRLTMLQYQLENLYQSYSWRFGHFIFSKLEKLAFWKKHSSL